MRDCNIAQLWDYYLALFYNKDKLIEELSDLLNNHKSGPILDCACGTGFHAIGLKKKGLDIYCSDGSQTMLNQFKIDMEQEGVQIPYRQSRWQELSQTWGEEKFSTILCIGGSLQNCDAWGTGKQTEDKSIKTSVNEFYKCLSHNGLLILDYNEFCSDNKKYLHTSAPYQEGVIDGKIIGIQDKIIMEKTGLRFSWEPTFYVDGIEYKIKTNGRLLTFGYLSNLLENIGFKNIRKVEVKSEPIYQVVFVNKT